MSSVDRVRGLRYFDLMPFRPLPKVQFVLFHWRWSFEITAASLVVAVVQLHDRLPVV